MSKFGKYAIVDPVRHNFKEEPELWWAIRPPTVKEEIAMSKFLMNNRIVIGPDGSRREQPPTSIEVAAMEVVLTFAGTNIPADVDKPVAAGGDPAINAQDHAAKVEAFIFDMPREMLMELWYKVGEVVPTWGPMLPKETVPMTEPI